MRMSRLQSISPPNQKTLNCSASPVSYSLSEDNCVTSLSFPDANNYYIISQDSASGVSAPTYVSALLVIVGWWIVYKTQANRERRKQLREYIGMVIKDLLEMEIAFLKYHTSERDIEVESSLIGKLTRFEVNLELLPKFVDSQWRGFRAVPPSRVTIEPKLVQQMRQAMTLYHFMDEHVCKKPADDPLVDEISASVDQVKSALEEMRLAVLD